MRTTKELIKKKYGLDDAHFFITNSNRDTYYSGHSPTTGEYCAVSTLSLDDPELDEKINNETLLIWNLEQWNGISWNLVTIDENFALVVTNDGLKALTYAETGEYKLSIKRVAIRSTLPTAGANLINWTENYFVYNSESSVNQKNLLVLDTGYLGNPTFTLDHNFSYRINMKNGGIQYSIMLDADTVGLDFSNPHVDPESGSVTYDQLPEFDIGAVGLFVQDPEKPNSLILFAVGAFPNVIKKYVTTATKVGNAIKFYLNTVLSNLGYVSDLETVMESVTSIPEVVTKEELIQKWDATTTPHNIYLVDDLDGSGIPALAVRQGDPVVGDLTWTYFTPNTTDITIDRENECTPECKDYMVVAWNGTKYEPALGSDTNLKTQGILIGNTIVYDHVVTNKHKPWKYKIDLIDTGNSYKIGDTFKFTATDTLGNKTVFMIKVSDVELNTGKIKTFSYSPISGDNSYNINNFNPILVTPSSGVGATFKLSSVDATQDSISWDFPSEWINKPLFVSTTDPGYMTDTETPETDFIGWCKSENSVQLALDLRTQATETTYGTTRYATDDEVKNVSDPTHTTAGTTTSVVPSLLQAHYLQKTKVAGNPGESFSNPIHVYSNVRFHETLVGKGVTDVPTSTQNDNISFYGLAYRAQWGDLAEYYNSDRIYSAGTLICIGDGFNSEISIAKTECNGIISDKPGYVLGDKKSDYDLPVALIGKVPVLFAKDCNPQFGDKIYLSKNEPGRASTIPYGKCLGKIIDRNENLNSKVNILCSIKLSF